MEMVRTGPPSAQVSEAEGLCAEATPAVSRSPAAAKMRAAPEPARRRIRMASRKVLREVAMDSPKKNRLNERR